MTRGFTWAYYESDDGHTYAWHLDEDYAAMPERGWISPAAPGTPVYPRGWTPRRVVGVDDSGFMRTAIVATTTAPLWTGAATTFTFNGTDELAHTATVVKLKAERKQLRP